LPSDCDIAARTGRAFFTLFNRAEVIEAVRSEFPREPYWQRVLESAHAGGLQAVLDEYTHLLPESLGVAALSVASMSERIGNELISALTIRAATLRVDEVTAPQYAREVNLEPAAVTLSVKRRQSALQRRFGSLSWLAPVTPNSKLPQ
jgi:hypothetical protein